MDDVSVNISLNACYLQIKLIAVVHRISLTSLIESMKILSDDLYVMRVLSLFNIC